MRREPEHSHGRVARNVPRRELSCPPACTMTIARAVSRFTDAIGVGTRMDGMTARFALVCLVCSGCLGSSSPASVSHSTAATHSGLPHPVHYKVATVALGWGRTRASFVTRYPGGSFDAWLTASRTARFHFFIRVAGSILDGSPTFSAGNCHLHGAVMTCHAGSVEAIPTTYNPWRVWVVKTTKPAVQIHVRLRFTGSSAGA